MLRIWIGYDSKEPIAFHVLSHSILARASKPVLISPLVRGHLTGLYTRERGPTESTEFSMTRFLVPYLSDYHGYSLFMDCDMLCLTDINEIMEYVRKEPWNDVWVCQHDYTPKDTMKFLGQSQTSYPRKNWSSFMLFNCNNQAARRLTPEYVNKASGLALHRLHWVRNEMADHELDIITMCVCGHNADQHATSDHQMLRFNCMECTCSQFNRGRIGSLPLEWNHLVGEYEANPKAKVLHWTVGGPWFKDYENADHAAEWFAERDAMLGVK